MCDALVSHGPFQVIVYAEFFYRLCYRPFYHPLYCDMACSAPFIRISDTAAAAFTLASSHSYSDEVLSAKLCYYIFHPVMAACRAALPDTYPPDGQIHIIVYHYQPIIRIQFVEAHRIRYRFSRSIHICLGLYEHDLLSLYHALSADRLVLGEIHHDPVLLYELVYDVKARIVSCMIVFISRVAQACYYDHRIYLSPFSETTSMPDPPVCW